MAFLRMSPRERGLSAIMLALVSLYGAFAAYEWSERAKQAAITGFARAAPMDEARAHAIRVAWSDIEARSLADETPFVAALHADALVEEALAEAGVTDAQTRSEPLGDGRAPIDRVLVTVEGVYDASTFAAFLQSLARSDKAFGVESVEIQDEDSPRFRIALTAFYAGKAGS